MAFWQILSHVTSHSQIVPSRGELHIRIAKYQAVMEIALMKFSCVSVGCSYDRRVVSDTQAAHR